MKKIVFVFMLLVLPRMLFVEPLPFIEQTIEARCMVCQKRFTVVNLHPYFLGGSFGYICDYCRKKESKGKGDGCPEPGAPKIPWDRNADQSYAESQAALEYLFLWEKEFGSPSFVRTFILGSYTITLPSGPTAAGFISTKKGEKRIVFRLPKDTKGATLQIENIQLICDGEALVSVTKGDRFFKYNIKTGQYSELHGATLSKALIAVDDNAHKKLPNAPEIHAALATIASI